MNWDYDGDGIWGDVDAPYEQGERRRAAMERFKEEEKERALKYKEEERKKRMKLKAQCAPTDQAVGQEGARRAPSVRAPSGERQ